MFLRRGSYLGGKSFEGFKKPPKRVCRLCGKPIIKRRASEHRQCVREALAHLDKNYPTTRRDSA